MKALWIFAIFFQVGERQLNVLHYKKKNERPYLQGYTDIYKTTRLFTIGKSNLTKLRIRVPLLVK